MFQAFRSDSASPPRTSPTMIRSGRNRIVAFSSRCISTLSVARRMTAFCAAHWISGVSSMITSRCSAATSTMWAMMALVSVVLPVVVPPTTRMLPRSATVHSIPPAAARS